MSNLGFLESPLAIQSTLSRQQLTTTEDKTQATYKVADFLFLPSFLPSFLHLIRPALPLHLRSFPAHLPLFFYKYGFYLGLGTLTLMLELHVVLVDLDYYGFPN